MHPIAAGKASQSTSKIDCSAVHVLPHMLGRGMFVMRGTL
jgi:hypothetical protein